MICISTVTQGNLINVILDLLASSYLSTDLLYQVDSKFDERYKEIFTSMDIGDPPLRLERKGLAWHASTLCHIGM